MRADEALAVPTKALHDYGVVLSEDSNQDPLDWRFIVEGPVMIMSSATGIDGRGFRYLLGVWPSRAVFVCVSLVKIYATGGRQGVIQLLHTGEDSSAALDRINAIVLGADQSPRFARGFQPPGFRPLDTPAVLDSLERGEYVAGPGWAELDAAALRGYGDHPPEHWAAPGESCVMKYDSR
jgi:hypothetical protein